MVPMKETCLADCVRRLKEMPILAIVIFCSRKRTVKSAAVGKKSDLFSIQTVRTNDHIISARVRVVCMYL